MGMLLASRMKHDPPLVADWYPCAASNPQLLLATGLLVAAGLVGNATMELVGDAQVRTSRLIHAGSTHAGSKVYAPLERPISSEVEP